MKKIFFLVISYVVFAHHTTCAMSALHHAVEWGDLAHATSLLNDGVDVNQTDDVSCGGTPLHWAAQCRQKNAEELALLFLNHGANINQLAVGGITPLHSAAGCNNCAVALLLLNQGADANKLAMDGLTPLQWAVSLGHEAIAHVLQKWHMRAAQLTLCSALHQRLGDNSTLRQLDQLSIPQIARLLHPEHFTPQQMAVAATQQLPQHKAATAVALQPITATHNLLSNTRVQCTATAAIALLCFAAWQIFKH